MIQWVCTAYILSVTLSTFTRAEGACCCVCCRYVPQSPGWRCTSPPQSPQSQWDWWWCPWPSPRASCLHYGRWWSEAEEEWWGPERCYSRSPPERWRGQALGSIWREHLWWKQQKEHNVKPRHHFQVLVREKKCKKPKAELARSWEVHQKIKKNSDII